MRTSLLHETLREWGINCGSLFAEDLRHREPHRGSRWHLDEVCTSVDGVRDELCRAVNEHGFVLDIVLQRHQDTDAAKTVLTQLLGEYDFPEVMQTDKLRSDEAAIRETSGLNTVDHQQVISTASCNNLIEQRPSPIRVLFCPRQALKGRGFDLKATGLTSGDRLSLLFGVVTLVFVWCCVSGDFVTTKSPPKTLKHGYVAKSIFRLDLDTLAVVLSGRPRQKHSSRPIRKNCLPRLWGTRPGAAIGLAG